MEAETKQSEQGGVSTDSPVTSQEPIAALPPTTSAPVAKGISPKRRQKIVVGILVLVVVLLGGAGCWGAMNSGHSGFDENKNINHSEYQSLFLTNGQVYFGKLADLNHKYVTITDIYYLQVQQSQSLQQGTSGSNTSANSQVSLAKLGNELHGPEDKMYIDSSQVLFWENLKSDSKVVQAIQKYQNQ